MFCCSGMLVEEKRALKPIVNKLGYFCCLIYRVGDGDIVIGHV